MNLEVSYPMLVEGGGDNSSNRCERIKVCIDSYLERFPRLSLQSVEDKTGVPGSTLRRIMSLKGNPQPEAAIKIFQTLGFDQDLYSYMRDFHPDIAKIMLSSHLANPLTENAAVISEKDRNYFLNEEYYLILNLAYTHNGISEGEVFYELGRRGVEKLNELLEQKLIRLENGRYFGKTDSSYKFNVNDTKKRVEMALRYYRAEEAGTGKNWLAFQTESINEEGLRALRALNQKQWAERHEQIFDNPLYKGNITTYNASISSTFLAHRLGELQ